LGISRPIDPTKHYFNGKFEIETTVHKLAEWREKLAANDVLGMSSNNSKPRAYISNRPAGVSNGR
jgi:hypothetical protein